MNIASGTGDCVVDLRSFHLSMLNDGVLAIHADNTTEAWLCSRSGCRSVLSLALDRNVHLHLLQLHGFDAETLARPLASEGRIAK